MTYKITNPVSNQFEFFEVLEDAEARLVVVKNEFLQQEDYRFTVAKEVVDGNNTTWMSADLENDIEDYVYQVFNHNTGLHEQVSTLSAAKLRVAQLKSDFVEQVFAVGVEQYDMQSELSAIPSTTL